MSYIFVYAADAVDSRLEFPAPDLPPNAVDQKDAFAYTLLLNKPFPQLTTFTMSMYLKPASVKESRHHRQCIFSYKYKYRGEATLTVYGCSECGTTLPAAMSAAGVGQLLQVNMSDRIAEVAMPIIRYTGMRRTRLGEPSVISCTRTAAAGSHYE